MPEQLTPSCYSNLLFCSDLVTIGHFHLPRNSADFQTAGAISRPTMVFPRTQMWIQKQNQKRYLSHPNLLNFYDGVQEYVRYQPHDVDDICDWFEFSPEIINEALGDTHIAELSSSPVFSTPDTYLKQRLLIMSLSRGRVTAELATSISMELLDDALSTRVKRVSNNRLSLSTRLRYQEIVAKVEQQILATIEQPFLLEELAGKLGVSPFHLCRIFKLINGVSIHEYSLQLRLRLSLGDLPLCRDIAQLALDNGFSSHSHYSTRFKRVFGCTPRQFRQQIAVSTAPSNNQ